MTEKANPEFQKYGDKAKYDANYLRIFGRPCSCNPSKLRNGKKNCIACSGIGWVKK